MYETGVWKGGETPFRKVWKPAGGVHMKKGNPLPTIGHEDRLIIIRNGRKAIVGTLDEEVKTQ